MLRSRAFPPFSEADPLPPEDRKPTGDGHDLDGLYRREAPRLLRFFARRADRQDAHDLVQESFARFANADATQNGKVENPEAYLSRIAGNLLRDRAKTALRRSLAHHIPAEESSLPAPDLLHALEARDELGRLQAALARLRPKTRSIFLAHRVDGLSYDEIARCMGLSVKGVEWHMTKAIAHIHRLARSR